MVKTLPPGSKFVPKLIKGVYAVESITKATREQSKKTFRYVVVEGRAATITELLIDQGHGL